jgi:ABC-type antimicrobial peptide transport system permease subunit
VILTIDNPNDSQLLRQYFYNFNVSEPFKDVNRQIDGIINVLIIVLSIFSSIIFAISIFLLSLIIKSFILDFKEDLHVLYCNGLSKKEIAKILKTYIFSTLLKATFTTIIFNLGISAVISFAVSQALKISFKYSFSIFSILASVILSLIMIFVGSLFTDKFIKKEDVVISIRN